MFFKPDTEVTNHILDPPHFFQCNEQYNWMSDKKVVYEFSKANNFDEKPIYIMQRVEEQSVHRPRIETWGNEPFGLV